jgi:hypothetical protein
MSKSPRALASCSKHTAVGDDVGLNDTSPSEIFCGSPISMVTLGLRNLILLWQLHVAERRTSGSVVVDTINHAMRFTNTSGR